MLINGANPIIDEKYPLTEHPNYKLMADSPEFDIKKYMAEKRRREERELSARIAAKSRAKSLHRPKPDCRNASSGRHYKSSGENKGSQEK